MAKMVEVIIDSVRVSLTNQQRIVVLREANTERYLPIWIGPYEAESITIALQEVEVARPQTHDLLKNVFTALNAHLLRVEIIALKDEVFYGNIVAEVDGRQFEVDSRPSDALALAVRAHVPVLVSHEIMDSAGIIPEADVQPGQEAATSAPPSSAAPTTPHPEGGEERLSVFEDFLQHLDLDNLSKKGDDEDDDEDDKPKPKGKKS
ncbi:MAG: bifunctional nuclease family protein [Anaerolineaceae bacterium]|nr:bifunctional nuclease family protein [Anaerolineaceae bacterium]